MIKIRTSRLQSHQQLLPCPFLSACEMSVASVSTQVWHVLQLGALSTLVLGLCPVLWGDGGQVARANSFRSGELLSQGMGLWKCFQGMCKGVSPRSKGWKPAVDKKTQVEWYLFSFMASGHSSHRFLSVGGTPEDSGFV